MLNSPLRALRAHPTPLSPVILPFEDHATQEAGLPQPPSLPSLSQEPLGYPINADLAPTAPPTVCCFCVRSCLPTNQQWFQSLTPKHCAGTSSALHTEEGLRSFPMILSGPTAHGFETAFTIHPLLHILSIRMKFLVCFSKLNESARAHKRPL